MGQYDFYEKSLNLRKEKLINKTLEQDEVRQKVLITKAFHNINYNKMAQDLKISQNAFYNWLNRQYNLKEENLNKLNSIIDSYYKKEE